MLADGHAGGAADSRAGLARHHHLFPCGRRHLHAGADDLHLIAVVQAGDERHDPAVDLGANRGVADIGVHRIGEIDGGGATRQGDQLAFGREAEHLVLEKFELGVLEELFRAVAFGQRFDGVAQPGIGVALRREQIALPVFTILVKRMGGDTEFGDLMHALGADLQLDTLARRADDGGVDGTIVVLLGRRDIILEAARHDAPARMHDTQRPVAGWNIVHQNAETVDIGKLLEGKRLRLHLAEHRIGFLLPPFDIGADQTIRHEKLAQLVLDLLDQPFIARFQFLQAVRHRAIGFRVEISEGQVLQLVAHILHTHAAGERRIDFHGFFGNAAALVGRHIFHGAHIVQTVGELHQENAHVVGNRKQQLAQVFRLLGLAGNEIELLELGQPLHQPADIFAEQLVDFGAGGGGVLDRIVQQRHRDGRFVEMHFGEDCGNFQRMGDVGVAIGPLLLAVFLHRVNIGLVQQGLIRIRFIFLNPLNEFVLPHHAIFHKKKARQPEGRRTMLHQ